LGKIGGLVKKKLVRAELERQSCRLSEDLKLKDTGLQDVCVGMDNIDAYRLAVLALGIDLALEKCCGDVGCW